MCKKLISRWPWCILLSHIVFSKDGWSNIFHPTCPSTICQSAIYVFSSWTWTNLVCCSSSIECNRNYFKTRLKRPCSFTLLSWDILSVDNQWLWITINAIFTFVMETMSLFFWITSSLLVSPLLLIYLFISYSYALSFYFYILHVFSHVMF